MEWGNTILRKKLQFAMINNVKQRKVEKRTCEREFYYLPAQC